MELYDSTHSSYLMLFSCLGPWPPPLPTRPVLLKADLPGLPGGHRPGGNEAQQLLSCLPPIGGIPIAIASGRARKQIAQDVHHFLLPQFWYVFIVIGSPSRLLTLLTMLLSSILCAAAALQLLPGWWPLLLPFRGRQLLPGPA